MSATDETEDALSVAVDFQQATTSTLETAGSSSVLAGLIATGASTPTGYPPLMSRTTRTRSTSSSIGASSGTGVPSTRIDTSCLLTSNGASRSA